MQVGSLALGPGGATCCHGLAPPGGKLSHILWHTGTVTQHIAHSIITQHTALSRDRTQNRRSKTQISWPSHFSSVAAFQQKIAAYNGKEFETIFYT